MCLDHIFDSSDCKLHTFSRTYTFNSDDGPFVKQFSNLHDDEIHDLLGLSIRMQETQSAAAFDLVLQCSAIDHDELFHKAIRSTKSKLKAELKIITISDINKPTDWQIAHTERRIQDKRYEKMCGEPLNRLTLCRYTMKVDGFAMQKKIKRKKQGESAEEALDVFMQCGIGMALDELNNKIAGSMILCRWRQQHAAAKLITTEKHPFQTQFRKLAYIDFIKRFNRFRSKKEEQFLWLDVVIGHNETNADFQQIASFALEDWNIWLYPKILQEAEESVQLSWVLWSSNQIDSRPFQEKLSLLMDMEVEVSLKRIKDGMKYGSNKKIEDCKKAWHVSVSKENVARGHDMLKKACARRNPRHPLIGIQRLVPLHGTATTDKEEQFVAKAQARQFAFMSQSILLARPSGTQ
eukprot:scaffold89839_cov30-Attheya_sp.AAC.1